MNLAIPVREEFRSGLPLNIPDEARTLIICDDDSEAKRLRTLLQGAGIVSECANSFASGCEAAKSGRFQVVVSTPQLSDGSWKRLKEIAHLYGLHYEVVLWARNFDLHEWGEALDNGAFEVLDAVYEEPRAVEATKGALWAAYLNGAGPKPIRNQSAGRS